MWNRKRQIEEKKRVKRWLITALGWPLFLKGSVLMKEPQDALPHHPSEIRHHPSEKPVQKSIVNCFDFKTTRWVKGSKIVKIKKTTFSYSSSGWHSEAYSIAYFISQKCSSYVHESWQASWSNRWLMFSQTISDANSTAKSLERKRPAA